MRIECLVVAVHVVGLTAAGGAKLPNWLVPCYKDDPKFNECALQHGREAIPVLVQGDRKFRVPSLDPLEVTKLHVDKEATKLGIDLMMTDIQMSGLRGSQLKDYRVDFEKRHISLTYSVPRIVVLCTYQMSGQILLLSITGQGPANITMVDSVFHYNVDYDLHKRANGKNYVDLKNSVLTFNATKAYFKIDNLFNGDKFLGENMNVFLNDNWEELLKEVGPTVSEALGQAIEQVFMNLAEVIPFDDMHPTKPR